MIGKVTKGNDFTGLLSYVLDKPGAKYIGASQLSGGHSHQWAAQFTRVAAKRRRTEYPVAHYSFSPHPNQPMADETAYRYAQKFCQRMGHENCQWLLVRHTDTKTENGQDRDHFHLVVNRVTIDGGCTVSSFNDWYRSQVAHRALIEEFDLHRVPSVWETDRRNPSTGQIRRVRRQNREYAEGARSKPADPIILTELQDRIDKFCQDRPRLPELVRRLRVDGVGVRIQPASNGGLAISYQLGSVAAAGSSLGRAYTVRGLQQRRLVSYQPEYDNPVLKLYLKDQWYERASFSKKRNRPVPAQNPGSPEPLLSPVSPRPTPGDRPVPRQNPTSTELELSPHSASTAQSKPDILDSEEYQQWARQVAPVLDAYLQHRGIPVVQGHRFRTYKRGQDLVLEYRDGSTPLMIAHNTSEGSWETPNCFPVERTTAEHILEQSLPAMQQDMRPTHARFNLRTPSAPLSQPDVLNGEEYQQWVSEVAPVLDAYLQHHNVSMLQGNRFRTYKWGQDLFLEDLENEALLMIAHKTNSGSWKPGSRLPVKRTIAQDILSESLPAMQLEMKLYLEHTSRQSPSRTPTPPPSKSPVATPTPTQDPPDVLNQQEYQQWVNRVAPFLNTYLKHRGGRMVEGERFRTYKRGQYLVLEYGDGSDTLILGRPTGKGSWETPDPVPVSVKREDANYILERSIPLMQRRMNQDKKRAQNKQRSRSRQLDISD
ncbi:relaxase/mobilization nuclease domain-containing protein [Laspinema olomoucense]|uniref:Relaxase/mobilization nuclease domain-containing protein n=1 Tax=Laspinema olomoucense D3b TaxID=2953688 RepID=A0ABT2NFA4_9CYAN|nr:relaxase/mobilization nuclease domain-containing protein [Laspinema sp. D3b]MCT7981388.1 relaxase/mobilization nuclease domain-containing protein [Laspinema sp. D3b]